ncbi:Type I restriction-modification system, specificity subunit S [Vibrio chagasii]|nr:Type I restriction-modification system, specificity subunit S [Vibrio chagasii]
MNCNWIEIPLGDFIEFKRGYDLPKSKRLKGDKPIISSAGLSDYHSESKVTSPGVVTGRYGTIGEVFYIEEDFWPLNTTLYVKDFKGNCPEFVYYLLKTFDFHKYSDKAAVPGVNRNHLHMEKVCVPSDYVWQERIASYISKFDKKITLSAQTDQTLEEMAQAIFKSWFVDFDPVKAKMNGEQPEGMDAITASLFPEKLVESELGLIPEGWEVKPFSEWVKITKGKNITKKTIVHGDVPVVAGGLKPAYFHNAHNVGGPAITISASGANAGYVNLYFENIWASDCSYISQSATPLFFLQYVALRYNQKKIFDMQTGAAQPHIYPRDFERLMIVVPNEELCRKLEEVLASFFGTVANNKQQNIDLAALRDTLLPKLLSGEIELAPQGSQ